MKSISNPLIYLFSYLTIYLPIYLSNYLTICHSFQLNHNKLISKQIIRRFSSDNINEFASDKPVVTEELPIDFDELSNESSKEAFTSKIDLSDFVVKEEERKAPRQAQWLPLLLSPAALDGSFGGDVGFDPLGFSNDLTSLKRYREAEIKHSRLAMLAAIGWPASELHHKAIADFIGLDSILADEGKAPSILNGGLVNEWIIGTAVFALVLSALLEYKTYAVSSQSNYRPGDLGFDPLSLYTIRSSFGLDVITEKKQTQQEKLAIAKLEMETSEIKHGRLAMLAITAYAAQEYVSGIPVIFQTPFFFGDPIV